VTLRRESFPALDGINRAATLFGCPDRGTRLVAYHAPVPPDTGIGVSRVLFVRFTGRIWDTEVEPMYKREPSSEIAKAPGLLTAVIVSRIAPLAGSMEITEFARLPPFVGILAQTKLCGLSNTSPAVGMARWIAPEASVVGVGGGGLAMGSSPEICVNTAISELIRAKPSVPQNWRMSEFAP
jgi:hypothetical protein